MNITYKRVAHAAHYAYNHPAKGHDLEVWMVESDGSFNPKRPTEVPQDAEYQCGEMTAGKQYWRFVRTAPLSNVHCAECARKAR